jgi:hypothetical protein
VRDVQDLGTAQGDVIFPFSRYTKKPLEILPEYHLLSARVDGDSKIFRHAFSAWPLHPLRLVH